MKFLVFLISFFPQYGWSQSPRPEINIYSNIEVAAEKSVTLADLATINFLTPELEKKAYAIEVLKSIEPEQLIEFSSGELMRLIRRKISQNLLLSTTQFAIFVPDRVKVWGRKNFISKQVVTNQIVLAFREKCDTCVVTVQEMKFPQIKKLQSPISWQLNTSSVKMGNSFLFPMQVSSGETKATYYVSGTIRLETIANVTTRRISPGEKIDGADYKHELVDISQSRDGIAKASDIQNNVSAKYIEAFKPIFLSDLKRELVISRGQTVKAVTGDAGFEVTSSVIAEEQGSVGDYIKLKAIDSKKTFSGQIIERGTVRIQ